MVLGKFDGRRIGVADKIADGIVDQLKLRDELGRQSSIAIVDEADVRAGKLHYTVFPRFYLPEETVNAPGPNHDHYQAWSNAGLLIATTVYVGLKPDVLLAWITPALQSPLMQAALKGGTP